MRRYLVWALVAFVVFYVLKSPGGAAHVVHAGVMALGSLADSGSKFLNALLRDFHLI